MAKDSHDLSYTSGCPWKFCTTPPSYLNVLPFTYNNFSRIFFSRIDSHSWNSWKYCTVKIISYTVYIYMKVVDCIYYLFPRYIQWKHCSSTRKVSFSKDDEEAQYASVQCRFPCGWLHQSKFIHYCSVTCFNQCHKWKCRARNIYCFTSLVS